MLEKEVGEPRFCNFKTPVENIKKFVCDCGQEIYFIKDDKKLIKVLQERKLKC